MIIDAVMDSFIDSVKLLPFLFLTYLAMEYLEHRAGQKMQETIRSAGAGGPAIGSVLGVFPQCGFRRWLPICMRAGSSRRERCWLFFCLLPTRCFRS